MIFEFATQRVYYICSLYILRLTGPVCVQDSMPNSALPIILKNFNVKLKHFVNADAATAANADAGGSAIALPVHSYRRDNKNDKEPTLLIWLKIKENT